MKRNLLLLAFFLLTPLYAFGDYVPGRVRAAAEGELQAQQGSGRYENVRAAHSILFVADGKGYVKFELRLDRHPAIPFQMTEIRPNRCGQVFKASYVQEGKLTTLEVVETNPSACRANGPTIWRTVITTDEGANTPPSQLELTGQAEYLMLSE